MFWLLLLVLMGSDVPEHVGDKSRIDECHRLRWPIPTQKRFSFGLWPRVHLSVLWASNFMFILLSSSLAVIVIFFINGFSLVTSFSSAKATFSSFSSFSSLFSPLLFPTELVIYNQEWRHWSLFEPASSVSDHSRGCYRRPSLSSASSAQDRVWLGKLRFFQSFGSPHGPHEIAKWHYARLLQSISFIIAFQGWGPERPGHIGADKRLIFQSFGSPYEITKWHCARPLQSIGQVLYRVVEPCTWRRRPWPWFFVLVNVQFESLLYLTDSNWVVSSWENSWEYMWKVAFIHYISVFPALNVIS